MLNLDAPFSLPQIKEKQRFSPSYFHNYQQNQQQKKQKMSHVPQTMVYDEYQNYSQSFQENGLENQQELIYIKQNCYFGKFKPQKLRKKIRMCISQDEVIGNKNRYVLQNQNRDIDKSTELKSRINSSNLIQLEKQQKQSYLIQNHDQEIIDNEVKNTNRSIINETPINSEPKLKQIKFKKLIQNNSSQEYLFQKQPYQQIPYNHHQNFISIFPILKQKQQEQRSKDFKMVEQKIFEKKVKPFNNIPIKNRLKLKDYMQENVNRSQNSDLRKYIQLFVHMKN